MSLRNAMFAGWIVGLTLDGANLTFSPDPAAQLILDFGPCPPLERIRAAQRAQHPGDR